VTISRSLSFNYFDRIKKNGKNIDKKQDLIYNDL